ncbi:ATP-dependent DNA helicase [Candidatus Bathyarchaeota archaeon]|nr:ATP-dependent DNA helicase [Candidatus Bathyarchaeota archaeon]
MSLKILYFCRRCGETYSFKDYVKSRFCRKCGTFLKKMSDEEMKLKTKNADEIHRLIKKYFPYQSFRPFQLKVVRSALDTIRDRRIGLLSSPCGTGKSISVLSAYFAARDLEQSIGRLLILTRTRNQLEIYSRELRNIKKNCDAKFTASIFKSKREMCPYTIEDPKLREIRYRDFLHYCKNMREGRFGGTCKYYDRTCRGWRPSWQTQEIVNKIKIEGPLLPDEVYMVCLEREVCPYEVTKNLARYADIIIGNYNYILVESVRNAILGKAGIRVGDINCVFDEAHNLPEYASGILSDELTSTAVRRALKEVRRFGLDDYDLLENLLEIMVTYGKNVYNTYGLDVEHVIDTRDLVNPLTERLNITFDRLNEIISELSDAAEYVRLERVKAGGSPLSYLSRCTSFLTDWTRLTSSSYAKYVKVDVDRKGRRRVRLGVRCLDPSLASSIINKLRSAILMSGTLWHRDYYIDVLGLDRNRCRYQESLNPFPPENRLIIVDKSVTTKFERRSEGEYRRIAEHLTKIICKINGRVAVYYPSYEVMREISKILKLNTPLLIEEKTTNILDVLKFMKSQEHCVVFGVARGKISEGIDMTNGGRSMLSAVINVGLPYPKRTELQSALYRYFREKFGDRAIEYVNDIPCLNALAQSSGRLLRSPEDKGIIIIMDRRAAGKFKWRLPKEWREEMKKHMKIEKILSRIENFYSIKKQA